MRLLPLLLVALLLVPLVPAQTMTVTSAHQVRIAYGDIPSTQNLIEDPDQWNVEQRLIIPEGGNATATIPHGHTLDAVYSDDGSDSDIASEGQDITVTCNTGSDDTEDNVCTMHIAHFTAGNLDAFGMSLPVGDDNTILVYTPEGLEVESATINLVGDGFYYPTTNLLIHQYQVENGRFWFTVSPQTIVAEPAGIDGGTVIWAGLTGLVVGVVAWYILVQQGVVQKRQRKQVAGMAAHKDVASKQDKPTLEWRRRALLAAMKELEVARMDQAIDLAAYDALKADFKRQTVTVMRALEELGE